MALLSWWEETTPHKDIREGHLSEAIFAADLGEVAYGKAPMEYQDASLFFQQTFLTQGLKKLIENVLSRLSIGKGDPVIQLQTPFGGGKTHSLLALFHIIKNRKKVNHLAEIAGLPEVKNAKIAVFVGTREETLKGRTPWGELAFQLNCYDEIREYDKKRYTPGKKLLLNIFEKSGPALILIDELAEYVSKAPPELATQVLAFSQELTETIKATDKCCLVCTLPSSAPYGEAGERALRALQQIFGRIEVVYSPVVGTEIYELVRKRLFEDFGDENIRKEVADCYFKLYQSLSTDIPSHAKDIEYRNRIEHAYPFHPELIDVLYERWGSYPAFQRTRGVLRLLAEIVTDLYKRKIMSPLIQSSLVNLQNQAIRNEFIKHIGNEYESVISADIASKNAKAIQIDKEMGSEYDKYGIAKGIATSVFLHSFSAGESKDTTLQNIRLALLREKIPPTIVGDAITKLEQELWYFHSDMKRYAFRNQPNLNRVIVDKEEIITEENINEELKSLLQKNAGRALEAYLWLEEPSDIPDNKNLKLAIVSPAYIYNSQKAKKYIAELFEKAGAGYRVYKNTLFALMVDDNQFQALFKDIKRLLAIQDIQNDKFLLERLTNQSHEEIKKKRKEIEKDIPFKILNAYRHISILGDKEICFKDMGIPITGSNQTISEKIKQYLKDQEKLLSRISPKYLLDKTFSIEETEKSAKDIYELFLKVPGMPLLENEKVLLDSIKDGIKTGGLAVRKDSEIFCRQDINPAIDDMIIKGEHAKNLKDISIVKEAELDYKAEKTSISEIAKEGKQIYGTRKAPLVKKLIIKAKIPWDKLSDLLKGVIGPLKDKGSPPEITIEIIANSEDGYDRTTLDSKVKETLTQINADIEQWEEE